MLFLRDMFNKECCRMNLDATTITFFYNNYLLRIYNITKLSFKQ